MECNSRRIYLDFNASTPLASEVSVAMKRFLEEPYGNPSSNHWAGIEAQNAVCIARSQVAAVLGCSDDEIVFTSGGSEANNHALKGLFFANRRSNFHIITSQVEHPAVLHPCRFLEELGADVTYLRVDQYGRVDPEDVLRSLRPHTRLISIMHANNEVGTIQPIKEIAQIAHTAGAYLHTDAAQSIGKIPCAIEELDVDLLSFTGHKLYGPKGVGALFVRRGVEIQSLIHGGSHESGRRAGTENVLLNVGLGVACILADAQQGMNSVRLLRDLFWNLLRSKFGNQVVLNGHPTERLPNTLNVSFVNQIGVDLLSRIPLLAASTGSACHSGSVELSPVLRAMNVPLNVGLGAIRFSLGQSTTKDDIEEAVAILGYSLRPSPRAGVSC